MLQHSFTNCCLLYFSELNIIEETKQMVLLNKQTLVLQCIIQTINVNLLMYLEGIH